MLKFTKISHENPSIEIAYYDSSNIKKSYYNYLLEDLSIVFSSGKIYRYANVSSIEYDIFKMSESQGKYLNSTIKNKEFTLLSEVETLDMIKEEEDEYNNSYADSLHELLKSKMKTYIEYAQFNETISKDIFNTLKTLLDLKVK